MTHTFNNSDSILEKFWNSLNREKKGWLLCLAPFRRIVDLNEAFVDYYLHPLKQHDGLQSLDYVGLVDLKETLAASGHMHVSHYHKEKVWIKSRHKIHPNLTTFLNKKLNKPWRKKLKTHINVSYAMYYEHFSTEIHDVLNEVENHDIFVEIAEMELENMHHSLMVSLNEVGFMSLETMQTFHRYYTLENDLKSFLNYLSIWESEFESLPTDYIEGLPITKSIFLLLRGHSMNSMKSFEKAQFYLERSITLAESISQYYKVNEAEEKFIQFIIGLSKIDLEKAKHNTKDRHTHSDIQHLKKLVEESPQHWKDRKGQMHQNMASRYMNAGMYLNAKPELEAAEKDFKRSGDDLSLAITYQSMGLLYNNIADYGTALKYYNKALQLLPMQTQPLKRMQTLMERGANYLAWDRLDDAEEDIRKSMKSLMAQDTYSLALGYLHLAALCRKRLNFLDMIEYSEMAQTLCKENSHVSRELDALQSKAHAQVRLQRFDAAKNTIDQILTSPNLREPQEVEANILLCSIYIHQEDFMEAEALMIGALNYFQKVKNINRANGLKKTLQELEEYLKNQQHG